MPSLVIANDIEFHYTDSGVPPLQDVPYITLIAVHGMGYNNGASHTLNCFLTMPSSMVGIFKRVQELAQDANLRIVAVNRRQYAGSTPVPDAESAVLVSGSDEQKAEFLAARGLELAQFAVTFIRKEGTPPISTDSKGGGVALLGWSSGNTATLAMIANVDRLPSDMQSCLAVHLRALIMQGESLPAQ
ncbi:hypothetical protein EVJ58_g4397 [Rhodofomes roseus]|uniref:Uncharacterized protein n=1 Tax=Rhodofomes roseus TaxID=34475 RepID=A0A4Y9YIV1_9APHY|nr:hypothetical protein EVJ58_g4397 [Rhodofomes roseus]